MQSSIAVVALYVHKTDNVAKLVFDTKNVQTWISLSCMQFVLNNQHEN